MGEQIYMSLVLILIGMTLHIFIWKYEQIKNHSRLMSFSYSFINGLSICYGLSLTWDFI